MQFHLRSLSGVNAGVRGERARQRIREIEERDAREAGRELPLSGGGSLRSQHTSEQLEKLCDDATVRQLEEHADGRQTFILQHSDVPEARLAQVSLLPPYPPGRFDAGDAGGGGVGPTLMGACTHSALPTAAAAPLISHLVGSLCKDGAHVEAVAALPGLSAWIATKTASDLDSTHGVAAADAAMMMAIDSTTILAFPQGMKMRTLARPVWEALATE
jgi:hypothetical protein